MEASASMHEDCRQIRVFWILHLAEHARGLKVTVEKNDW
jgi:hypothetical protein